MPQPYTRLTRPQRHTIARASRLMHDAGFREKARLLDDLIERGTIFNDPNITPRGSASADATPTIHLGPDLVTTRGNPPQPFDRTDAGLITLAGLLVLLADQALGHSRLEGLGDAQEFGRRVQRDKADLFPDANAATRDAAGRSGKAVEDWARALRDAAAKAPAPNPPPSDTGGKPPQKLKMAFFVQLPELGIQYIEDLPEVVGFHDEVVEGYEPSVSSPPQPPLPRSGGKGVR